MESLEVMVFTLLIVVIIYGLCVIILLGELVQRVPNLTVDHEPEPDFPGPE